MAKDGDEELDIWTRIGKASSVFQCLQPIYSKKIKLRLYSSIIVQLEANHWPMFCMEWLWNCPIAQFMKSMYHAHVAV